MDVLFSAQNLFTEVGGAEKVAQNIVRRLAKKHEVHAVARGKGGDYDREGVHVHEVRCPNNILFINLFWGRFLDRLNIKPDLVFTQLNAAPPTVFWAKKKSIPTVFHVHSFEHFCLDSFGYDDVYACGQRCWRCRNPRGILLSPAYKLIQERNRKALQEADVVITPSNFMRDVVRHYTGRTADVVPNPLDLESARAAGKGDGILFVGVNRHKGADLVSELVKLMPNRKFVLAGRTEKGFEWLAKERNVEYLGYVNDIRLAYAKARILIAPSKMADNSPTAIYEAMANGIPVIASDTGGAAEAAAEGGILLSTADADGWVQAIERLFADETACRRLGEDGKRKVQGLTMENGWKALVRKVGERTGVAL